MIPGALAGLAVGAVAVALIAHRAGVPVGDVLGHGLLTPTAVALAAGGTIGAIVAVVFALRAVDGPPPARRAPGRHGGGGSGCRAGAAADPRTGLGRLARQRPRDRPRGHAAPRRLRVLRPARAAARARASGRAPERPLRPLHPADRAADAAPLAGPDRRPRRLPRGLGRPRDVRSLVPLDARRLEHRARGLPGAARLHALDRPVARIAAGRRLARALPALAPGVGAWPVLRQTAEVAGAARGPLPRPSSVSPPPRSR